MIEQKIADAVLGICIGDFPNHLRGAGTPASFYQYPQIEHGLAIAIRLIHGLNRLINTNSITQLINTFDYSINAMN